MLTPNEINTWWYLVLIHICCTEILYKRNYFRRRFTCEVYTTMINYTMVQDWNVQSQVLLIAIIFILYPVYSLIPSLKLSTTSAVGLFNKHSNTTHKHASSFDTIFFKKQQHFWCSNQDDKNKNQIMQIINLAVIMESKYNPAVLVFKIMSELPYKKYKGLLSFWSVHWNNYQHKTA